MSKVKELIKKTEFSKKLTIAVLLFVATCYGVAFYVNTQFGVDLSVYTGQLIVPTSTVLGFYSLKSGYENGIKIKNGNSTIDTVVGALEEVADEMNGKNG